MCEYLKTKYDTDEDEIYKHPITHNNDNITLIKCETNMNKNYDKRLNNILSYIQSNIDKKIHGKKKIYCTKYIYV